MVIDAQVETQQSADADRIRGFDAAISALAFELTEGVRILAGTANITAIATVAATFRVIHTNVVVYKIPAETRIYEIPGETRTRMIAGETRVYKIRR